MAQQGTRGLTNDHQPPSDPSTAGVDSSSIDTVCSICEAPYDHDHCMEFTFCCDQPIGSHCYQTILDEGMECAYCGKNVQPKQPKPQYILRFGHRLAAAAQASMTPKPTTSSEDQNDGSQCTSANDATPADTMPEESPDERAWITKVQVFLLHSFERFLEDVRVFDEEALTGEQKLGMVKKLELQLGLRA